MTACLNWLAKCCVLFLIMRIESVIILFLLAVLIVCFIQLLLQSLFTVWDNTDIGFDLDFT